MCVQVVPIVTVFHASVVSAVAIPHFSLAMPIRQAQAKHSNLVTDTCGNPGTSHD